MNRWMRRVRAAVVMGVTWAVVWAPVGVLVGLIVDPDGSTDEMWFLVFGYPGFLGGVVFSIVLALRARRRRVDDLSVTRVGGWGAVAGLLVGTLPFLVGTPTNRIPLWLLASTVVSSTTLLSALSAAGTLAIARRGKRPVFPTVPPDENALRPADNDDRPGAPRGPT